MSVRRLSITYLEGTWNKWDHIVKPGTMVQGRKVCSAFSHARIASDCLSVTVIWSRPSSRVLRSRAWIAKGHSVPSGEITF